MKRFVLLLLVISAVVQPLSKTGIYLLFQVNRTYISSFVCEQRQVPTSDCKGKCYLKKELRKDSEREESKAPTNKQPTTDIILIVTALKLKVAAAVGNAINKYPIYTSSAYFTVTRNIFHPPRGMA